MKNRIAVLVGTVLLSGCAKYYPLPIAQPTLDEYNALTNKPNDQIPIPDSLKTAKQYSLLFKNTYSKKKAYFQEQLYSSSDFGFFSTLAALIAGIAKSPEGVATGGASAAAFDIGPSRYQLAKQKMNYEMAELSATCINDELRKINSDTEIAMAVYEEVIGKKQDKTVGILTYQTLNDLQSKLRTAQSKVDLTAPDLSKLQKALEELKNKKEPDKETGEEADKIIKEMNSKNEKILTFSDITVDAKVIKTLADKGDTEYKKLQDKLNVCLEKFTAGS